MVIKTAQPLSSSKLSSWALCICISPRSQHVMIIVVTFAGPTMFKSDSSVTEIKSWLKTQDGSGDSRLGDHDQGRFRSLYFCISPRSQHYECRHYRCHACWYESILRGFDFVDQKKRHILHNSGQSFINQWWILDIAKSIPHLFGTLMNWKLCE